MLLSLLCWAFPTTASGYTVENAAQVKVETKQTNDGSTIRVDKIPVPALKPNAGKVGTGKPVTKTDGGVYDGRHYSKDEVIQLIKDYSAQYGIDPAVPLRIAKCESGYNQFSKNRSSSASGVFQYLSGTWKGTDEAKAGLSVWDADANVKAAVKYMAIHHSTQPWVCK